MLKDHISPGGSDKKSVLILFLFIFQMLGVRIFQGIGITLSIIIFLMLIGRVRLSGERPLVVFFISMLCGLLQLCKGTDIAMTINISFQIVNAILLAYYYAERELVKDLSPAIKIFVTQALLALFVVTLLPESYFKQEAGILGKHFYYVFYRMNHYVLPGIPRLSGWAWEPGCLQMLLNLYLFLVIQDKSNKMKDLWWIVILIMATGSTSGYAILMLNFVVYGVSRSKSNFFLVLVFGLMVAILILPFIWDNISSKLMLGSDEINTSGIIRYRDFYMGLICLRDYPLVGIDMTNPAINQIYQAIEHEAIGLTKANDNWYQYFTVADGGYTNGLFGITMMWGVFGIYLLLKFAKCSLWKQFSVKYWYVVPTIIALSLISEPISNTAFFWFLCIYDVVNKKK